MGLWVPIESKREMLILSYPRSAGSALRRVRLEAARAPPGYKKVPGQQEFELAMLPGSVVIRQREQGVWEAFAVKEDRSASRPKGRATGSELLKIRELTTYFDIFHGSLEPRCARCATLVSRAPQHGGTL